MILDALFKIKNEQDPTFSFRRLFLIFIVHCVDPAVRVFAVLVL